MTDVSFRSNEVTQSEPVPQKGNETVAAVGTDIEPPFTNYRSEKNKSAVAEYFGIDEGWDDKEVYGKEIDEVENYFKDKIDRGDMENTLEAVKQTIKKYEKEIGYEKTERVVVKIQKLLAYLSFRRVVDEVERNSKIYGTR